MYHISILPISDQPWTPRPKEVGRIYKAFTMERRPFPVVILVQNIRNQKVILDQVDLMKITKTAQKRLQSIILSSGALKNLNILLPRIAKLYPGDVLVLGRGGSREWYRASFGISSQISDNLKNKILGMISESETMNSHHPESTNNNSQNLRLSESNIITLPPDTVADLWITHHLSLIEAGRSETERKSREALDMIHKFYEWPEHHHSQYVDPSRQRSYFRDKLLYAVGYRVGSSKKTPDDKRRKILSIICEETLPKILPPEELKKWGDPGTGQRVRRLAAFFITAIDEAKRRDNPALDLAITDWENDLAWLKGHWELPSD